MAFKKWTEVEDFYLRGKVGELSLEVIAKKLKRTLPQVKKRMEALALKAVDKYLSDMRVVNSSGQVVESAATMTQSRALRDEQEAPSGGREFLNSLKSSIAPIK
jgi:hypothetical protein